MTVHFVAEALTQPEALAAVASAPEARIEVCAGSWQLSAESRSAIGEFLERYRAAGGALDAPTPGANAAPGLPATSVSPASTPTAAPAAAP